MPFFYTDSQHKDVSQEFCRKALRMMFFDGHEVDPVNQESDAIAEPREWTKAELDRAGWMLVYQHTTKAERNNMMELLNIMNRPAYVRLLRHWDDEFYIPPKPPDV